MLIVFLMTTYYSDLNLMYKTFTTKEKKEITLYCYIFVIIYTLLIIYILYLSNS